MMFEDSEVPYRALVEHSPDGIVVHETGRILYANAAMARWMGRPAGTDLVDRHICDLIHPDDLEVIKIAAGRISQAPEKVHHFEIRLSLGKRSSTDVAITSCAIEFAGRQARQVIVRDLSHRKMEAQLLQDGSLAAIGELSTGILHELAQPLNISRLTAQAALRRIQKGEASLDKLAANYALIDEQMARMAEIIDHMRVFVRFDIAELGVSASQIERSAPVESDARQMGYARTILVVEDEPIALELLCDFANELGFEVLGAATAEDALLHLDGNSADLVISDIRLPGRDGIALAQDIRRTHPGMPIIFVTGHMGVANRLDVFGDGTDVRLLNKPIDLDELEAAIHETLAASRPPHSSSHRLTPLL